MSGSLHARVYGSQKSGGGMSKKMGQYNSPVKRMGFYNSPVKKLGHYNGVGSSRGSIHSQMEAYY